MSLYELFGEEIDRKLATYPSRSLSDMAVAEIDADSLKKKVDIINRVDPKVDYSDFANFVFFNSAYDYFRISAERILNEYPYDGSHSDLMTFLSESDGYQNYLLDNWPKATGTLLGGGPVVDGGGTAPELHPGTGSFSVEAWFTVPIASAAGYTLMHRDSQSRGSWRVHIDASDRLTAEFTSGTTSLSCSCSLNDTIFTIGGSPFAYYGFFSVVVDSAADKIFMYLGTTASLPNLMASSSYTFATMSLGSGTLYLNGLSGSYSTVANTGEFRIWNTARSLNDIRQDYRTRIYASDDLIGYWRANERTTSTSMKDFSGYKRNVTLGLGAFVDSSILPWDEGDYVLDISDSEVYTMIQSNQQSAMTFDRNNASAMVRLVPEKFLLLEDDIQTDVLKKLLYLLARQFDELKVKIDHFTKLYSANYTEFDQTPDALLEDALKFWGWDAKGSFLSKEGAQYLFGINVLTGNVTESQKLEESLYTIKNEFWRRILNNLPYLYKTKGTKESLEALLRVHGLTDKLLKVKEFGLQKESKIVDSYIQSERSVSVAAVTGSSRINNNTLSSSLMNTVELHVKFPNNDSDFARTLSTGSIFRLTNGNSVIARVDFEKSGTTSTTGNLVVRHGASGSALTSSFTIYSAPIFNGEWHHIVLIRSGSSGTLQVRKYDAGSTSLITQGSGALSGTAASASHRILIGQATSSFHTLPGEFYLMELRAWSRALSSSELDNHTMNFQSYGTSDGLHSNLLFHYPLNALTGASDIGQITIEDAVQPSVIDGVSFNFLAGSGSIFPDYVKYSFLASPDYGWNEEKIRVWDAIEISPGQQYYENSSVALEFNLVDSLNEDISLMLASLNNWNNLIGDPANRYRENYQKLDNLRRQYFARLTNRINFRVFADFLDFFDRSFIELAKKLIPAHATFQGAEFVVESHMLERPKVQQYYRRLPLEFQPEGRMVIFANTYYDIQSLNLTPAVAPAGDPIIVEVYTVDIEENFPGYIGVGVFNWTTTAEVTWSIVANGGDSTIERFDVETALFDPGTLVFPAVVTVRATSVEDPTKWAEGDIHIVGA